MSPWRISTYIAIMLHVNASGLKGEVSNSDLKVLNLPEHIYRGNLADLLSRTNVDRHVYLKRTTGLAIQ